MDDRAVTCPPDDLLVDLALGQLVGRERAGVLEHVAGCRRCVDELGALLTVTEQLLLAAPEAQPPAGFETQVLARLTTSEAAPSRRHGWGSVLRLAAAAAVIAVVFLLGTVLAPNQSAVASATMITPSGREVGSVATYDASPSWVLLSVPAWDAWGDGDGPPPTYTLRATFEDGSEVELGPVTFHGDDGTWATATPVDGLEAVAVTDATGKVWCTARF